MAQRKRTQPRLLSDVLRAAIVADERTVYRLSVDAGVSQPQIGRFVRGERTLTLTAAEKLWHALRLPLPPEQ
jgi:hypothetical protein